MKKFTDTAKAYAKKIKGFIALGLGGAAAATVSTPAFAALDLSGVTIDTTDYITIATFLITALVAFWGIKKGLALLGR